MLRITAAGSPSKLQPVAGRARVLDAGRGAKLGALLLDLHRQLTCRRQHQHDRPVARSCAAQQLSNKALVMSSTGRLSAGAARSCASDHHAIVHPPRAAPHSNYCCQILKHTGKAA